MVCFDKYKLYEKIDFANVAFFSPDCIANFGIGNPNLPSIIPYLAPKGHKLYIQDGCHAKLSKNLSKLY